MKKLFTSILFVALALTASAQLAYNQAFTSDDYNNSATIVGKQGTISWDSNAILLGTKNTWSTNATLNWNDKFVIIALEAGHSKSISFTTDLTSSLSTIVGSNPKRFWTVYAGATQDNLETIWTEADKNNPGNVNIDLDKTIRYVKICFSGNYAGYVKNLTVSGTKAVVTYGSDEASVCQSELPYSFNGQEFTESGSVTLSGANIFGLDSIITLTLNVLPSYSFSESQTIYVGAEEEWHKQALSTYAVGTYTLYDSLQTAAGCDSIYTLALTVLERPTTYGAYEASFCEGDSLEYLGKTYYEATVDSLLLSEKNILGGDSILVLTVSVNPTFTATESLTIEAGTDTIWHDQSLALYEEGEYTLYDSLTTEQGCDSVIVLSLTVTPSEIGPSTPLQQQTIAPAATKVLRNGALYIRRDDVLFDLRGQRVEE